MNTKTVECPVCKTQLQPISEILRTYNKALDVLDLSIKCPNCNPENTQDITIPNASKLFKMESLLNVEVCC